LAALAHLTLDQGIDLGNVAVVTDVERSHLDETAIFIA
jgi:hypothetical protein